MPDMVAKTAVQHDGVMYAPGTDLPPLEPNELRQLKEADAVAADRDDVIDPETNELRPGATGNSLVDYRQGVLALEPISGEVLSGGDTIPVYARGTTERLPDPTKSAGRGEKTVASKEHAGNLAEQARVAREGGEGKEKCKGTKASGEPCQITALANGYCSYHQDQAGSGGGAAASTAGSNVHGPEGGEKRVGG